MNILGKPVFQFFLKITINNLLIFYRINGLKTCAHLFIAKVLKKKTLFSSKFGYFDEDSQTMYYLK